MMEFNFCSSFIVIQTIIKTYSLIYRVDEKVRHHDLVVFLGTFFDHETSFFACILKPQ